MLFGGTTEVIGSGAIDASVEITATDLLNAGASYEGSPVHIGDLTLVDPSEWPTAGSSGFVRVTDRSVEAIVYVDDDTDLAGSSPPAGPTIFGGFVAQNDSFPFLDDHYLYLLTVEAPVSVEASSWGHVKSTYR